MYKLLNTNTKLQKQNKQKYLIQGLTLAPHRLGGFESVCAESTVACRQACVLWFTGRTVMEPIRNAAIRRTRLFFENREMFESLLCKDLAKFQQTAAKRKLIPVCRLNVASDLDWTHIVRKFPNIQFYDYTKIRSRYLESLTNPNWPSNYRLTYSYTGSDASWETCLTGLRLGGNVAMIFSTRYYPQRGILGELPINYSGFSITDGDLLDVRLPEIDGKGTIVGLRFKGSLLRRAKAIKQGFCINVGSGI